MITISQENAAVIKTWFEKRGGLRVWNSVSLSDPSKQWLTPGDVSHKPHWSCGSESTLVTDPADVQVARFEEVKRIRVAIRPGRQGLTMKLTDGSTRKVERALAKYPDSTYVFDYDTQEAVILVPCGYTSLA